MDVTGAVLDRLDEHEVDEADDGRLVGQVLDGGRIGFGLDRAGFGGQSFVGAQLLQDFGEAFIVLAAFGIELLDELFDAVGVGHDDLDVLLEEESQFIDASGVERVGQREAEGRAVKGDRQALVHAGGFGGDILDEGRGQLGLAQGDDFGAEAVGDDLQDGVQVQNAEVLQDLHDGLAAALELPLDFFELQVVDEAPFFDQRQQRV